MANILFVVVENLRQYYGSPLLQGSLLHLLCESAQPLRLLAVTALNSNTVNRYLTLIGQAIVQYCQRESPFSGEVELDESYFAARPVRGKRGRGTRGKTIVFGIYKRTGRVYTEIIPNCKVAGIQAIIRGGCVAKIILRRGKSSRSFYYAAV